MPKCWVSGGKCVGRSGEAVGRKFGSGENKNFTVGSLMRHFDF